MRDALIGKVGEQVGSGRMGEQRWVPEHVRDYLRRRGFSLPLEDMEPWIGA